MLTFFVLIFDVVMASASIVMLNLGVSAETVQTVLLAGTLLSIVAMAIFFKKIRFSAALQALIALVPYGPYCDLGLTEKITTLAMMIVSEAILAAICLLCYLAKKKVDKVAENDEFGEFVEETEE